MERITFGKFAGLKINGKIDMPEPEDFDISHLSRASWLTAQVESGGKFGTVMNYDGTGMTAGIHQAIAVYPRALDDNNKENDQGPLWELISDLKAHWLTHLEAPITDCPWNEFEDWLFRMGIYIEKSTAYPVGFTFKLRGKTLRRLLSGDEEGVLPKMGASRIGAESVIKMFHKLFSSEWTFETQLKYGTDNFQKDSFKKLRFCTKGALSNETLKTVVYSDMKEIAGMSHALDLAMSVYWSNSVNAPGYALKILCKVIDSAYRPGFQNGDVFPRKLIQAIGTAQYGRWDDDIPGGRYQRTRDAAMKKWPKELFVGPNAIMPKDLVG
jgi:hypothetical protein